MIVDLVIEVLPTYRCVASVISSSGLVGET